MHAADIHKLTFLRPTCRMSAIILVVPKIPANCQVAVLKKCVKRPVARQSINNLRKVL